MNDPVPNIREYNTTVPAEVNTVFRKMMAKDPAARGTATELAAELRGLLDRTHTPRGTPRTAAPPPEPARPARRTPTPGPIPKPKPPPVVDDDGGGLIGLFEKILLPAEQRASAGELSAGERIAALLRRPLTILLLLAFVAVTMWCVWWR